MLAFGLLPFLLSFASASALAPRATTACNNSPSLCGKSYGEITHLGAHDSPFVRDAATQFNTAGNQFYNTTVQLSAGVRLVTAQVHKNNNTWELCHTSCGLLDAGTLASWLSEIKTWLDNNPNEVITVLLVNSDNAGASDLNTEFEAANIVQYAYKPSSTTPPTTWPTLQELITAGTRMMTFVASLSSNTGAEYLMDEFTYIFENSYQVTSASNFSCAPDRPSTVANDLTAALGSNRLPFMNHFLDSSLAFGIDVPDVNAIDTTNGQSGTGNLLTAATTCQGQYSGRQPTFVLVDFFDKGPAIDVVDKLNNVTNATGRTPLPANSTSESSGGNLALVNLVNSVKAGSNPTLGNWIWVGGSWGNLLGGGVSI